MARKRQIDPCYPFEKEIRLLSIPARYFYLLSWGHMSDPNTKENIIGGVLPYDIFYLKSNIFPEEDIEIEPLIKEILAHRRYFSFQTQGKKWLWCPTMAKHQNIQHPAKHANYPDPPPELVKSYNNHTPLNEPSMSPHIPLTQSRVELSRVELKDQPNPAALSINTKDLLKTVFNKGVNIYQCLEKFKKQYHKYPPEDCIVKVCSLYLRQPDKIKEEWPWFITSMAQAMKDWYSTQNIKEDAKLKKAPVIQSIKEIMAGIGKGA